MKTILIIKSMNVHTNFLNTNVACTCSMPSSTTVKILA